MSDCECCYFYAKSGSAIHSVNCKKSDHANVENRLGFAMVGLEELRANLLAIETMLVEKDKEIEILKTKIKAPSRCFSCGETSMWAEDIDYKHQLELSQKREVALKKAVDFYADKNNWHDNDLLGCPPSIFGDSQAGDEFGDSKHLTVGGKRARQALKEVEGLR
jgi:hypothetical protein